MFIFGTKGRQEPRGIVGDSCSACGGVRPFEVVDHYEVGHVYFVAIGEGERKGTSIKCLNCGSQYQFNPGRYQRVLPMDNWHLYNVEEIVAYTNPTLAALMPAAPPEPETHFRCVGCGHTRNTPFKFCPTCGDPRG